MNERVRTLLDGRRERLRRAAGRDLKRPTGDPAPLPEADREHLLDYARELYWNELEWENLTEEELLDDGPLADLTFPGFLAFVRGLLLAEAMPDSLAPASPRPQVVEDILVFLGDRLVTLNEEGRDAVDPEEQADLRQALEVTSRLIDLVMFQFYGLTSDEIAAVEELPAAGS